ncbi:MAG: response regulator [Candidatus Acidiferrales bacterium]
MPGKVLIADDSLKIQKELTRLIESLGVEVTSVSNGEHAVRQLANLKPDLVLADIFMPVRTGYEVCDYIKTRDEFSHTIVLLLASKMEPYDEKEARRVGADGKIDKPVAGSEQAVLATIKGHLEKILAARPAAPIDEFAAAVPATEEAAAAAEPEPDMFATAPPPVSFEGQASVGFADMVGEEAAAAPPAPPPPAPIEMAPAAPPAPAESVDLTGATMLTTAADLKKRMDEIKAQKEMEETRIIEKPTLAAAWEMTGPEPGAPPVPPAGGAEGWDSQWKGASEEAPAAAVEEVAATPAASGARLYPAEEFAAAFGGAATAAEGEVELAPAEIIDEAPAAEAMAGDELVAAELHESLPGGAAAPVDPAVVEDVVNQVLARLSPQVMETIAREIVRPLAEALLREKLRH